MFISLHPDERAHRQAQALRWACGHSHAAHLATHGEAYPYGPFPELTATGAKAVYAGKEDAFSPKPGLFWVGALSYDYGCQLQGRPVQGGAGYTFFSPEHILLWRDDGVEIVSERAQEVWEAVCLEKVESSDWRAGSTRSQSQEDYEAALQTIMGHLHRGEAYEINYCLFEAAALDKAASLPALYQRLTARSPMPFQYLLKTPEVEMVGSSPERFLRREGERLISQPIKGTAPRDETPSMDETLRQGLRHDEKSLAENMMITDLVRNDLAQACLPGSVEVEELFGLYTFKRLHQLITTVSGKLQGPTGWDRLLRATFPMGSMTGAPKGQAMDIIRETESGARGYFSGAVGYILPDGDFDLAVIIRTLFNEGNSLKYAAGGAIVWDSQPAQEWAEVALKMEGMRYAAGS